MNYVDAIILGIVEGLTEFFPISSTGHLILAADLLRLPETEFLKTFQIAIQLGAILAVVALYWRRLLFDQEMIKRIIVALLPALGVGFLFYRAIKGLFESSLVVVVALFVGGAVLVLYELFRKDESEGTSLDTLSYWTAFFIGLFQTLSVIPGVSRAGATILGGLLLGLKRTAIVEFSFLLAVPTMVAATALDVWQSADAFTSADFSLLGLGMLVSFLVAIAAVRFLIRFVESHSFVVFGVYRMIVAILVLLFIL